MPYICNICLASRRRKVQQLRSSTRSTRHQIIWKKQLKLNRNMIKNPNWQDVTSWLFTKRGRVESWTTGYKPEVRTGFDHFEPLDHAERVQVTNARVHMLSVKSVLRLNPFLPRLNMHSPTPQKDWKHYTFPQTLIALRISTYLLTVSYHLIRRFLYSYTYITL